MDIRQLRRRQAYPLDVKVLLTKYRIRQWWAHHSGKVYVSVSGKDSRVLLILVRSEYPDVPAVFCDTGMEFPEIRKFWKTQENVIVLRPKMNFRQVIEKFGYPVISKEVAQKVDEIRTTKSQTLKKKRLYGDGNGNGRLPLKWRKLIDMPFKISDRCCHIMKKNPFKRYEKETGRAAMVGSMAEESRLRETQYLQKGCNAFDATRPMSTPLAFWTSDDIWKYIKLHNMDYPSVYDLGYERTGCMFCMFGLQHEHSGFFEKNRFERMKTTHPKQYNYCMDQLGLDDVLTRLHLNH